LSVASATGWKSSSSAEGQVFEGRDPAAVDQADEPWAFHQRDVGHVARGERYGEFLDREVPVADELMDELEAGMRGLERFDAVRVRRGARAKSRVCTEQKVTWLRFAGILAEKRMGSPGTRVLRR